MVLVVMLIVHQSSESSESFALSHQAVGSDSTLFVDSIHGFVAWVAWNLNLIVLDDVLLDDCVASAKSCSLLNGSCIEVSLGDETIVSWNVSRRLSGSNSELVVLVALGVSFRWQLVARVVTVCADRLLELCLEVAALGGVCLSVVGPKGSFGHSHGVSHLRFICHLGVCLPVSSSTNGLVSSLLEHSLSALWVPRSTSCVSK